MAKIKVHELAKEIDAQSKDIIACLTELGIEGKTASSGLEDDQVEAVKNKLGKAAAASAAPAPKSEAPQQKAANEQPEAKGQSPEAPAKEQGGEKKLVKRPPEGAAPKKKKIIVVSNLHNSQTPGQRNGAGEQRGNFRNDNRNDNRNANAGTSGRPTQGIIRPTVPTTAERQARLAELGQNQGGDRNRLRKDSTNVPKENKENLQTNSVPAGDDSVNVGDNGRSADVQAAATRPVAVEKTNVVETVNAQQNNQNRAGQNREMSNRDNQNRDGRPARDGQNRDNQNRDGRFQRDGQNRDNQNRDGRPARDGQGRDFRQNRDGAGRDNQGRDGRPVRDGQSRDGRPARDGQGRDNQGRDGRPARDTRGGSGMGQGKNFGAAQPVGKDEQKPSRKEDRRKGQDKNRREYDNEDGFRGGKPVKGSKVAKLEKPGEKKQQAEEEKIKVITIPETITIKELADKMKVQAAAIIKKLFLQGKIVTVNEEVSYEEAEEIAVEYDILCEKEVVVDVIEELLREEEEDPNLLESRSPVVCVMGHVDHGKTSLLDAIRKTKVIDKEAGGITQHIGAYVVDIKGQKITFLDTPGHEAFTAMRMRGANATDIAILVVAADDGVMPQTIEAINHAKAAGIEIIVAVNKIDKPSANIDRVKQELTEYELVAEDWGGSTVFAPVSAKTGEGIEQLLEMILLTSDMLELKANAKRKARGLVIEAQLDKGRGPVATVLVQKGTLKVGDFIAAGECHGKVRAMIDDSGRRVKEAGPSTPVEILGLNDVPGAGEIFVSLDSDKEAKNFADTFIAQNKVKLLDDTKAKMSLDDLFSQIQAGNLKELNLIIKADVQGSVEAVKESLLKLTNEEVVVKVIHSGVGAINESDVILASASNAIIIGFNVRPDSTAKEIAEREGVDVRLYDVIYKAIEDVEAAMKGMLDPIFEEKIIGHAVIRQIFKASGIGNIAGSYVTDGIMQRNSLIRITREGEQIYEGKLASLKRFKDDVKEVKTNFECGLVFEEFNDLAEDDVVEAYIMVEVPRT